MAFPGTPPGPSDVVLQWRPDWLTIAVLVVLSAGYVRARLALRARGEHWSGGRDLAFAVSVVLAAWTSSGVLEARRAQLMWVFTTQQLVLLLIVPVVLMAAQPLALARAAAGPHAVLLRIRASRAVRWLGHPALSLVYVPVLSYLLFFGGLGDLALRHTAVGWGLHLALLCVGAAIALPLLDAEDSRTSLAVGATLAIGAVELLLDAVPGIVLRLETHPMMPSFVTGRPAWSPSWLADQQSAGTILWTVAELLDLPFLVLAVRQWIRVDRRETVLIDAELDRAAAAAESSDGAPAAGRPWWLDHPELRRRFGEAE